MTNHPIRPLRPTRAIGGLGILATLAAVALAASPGAALASPTAQTDPSASAAGATGCTLSAPAAKSETPASCVSATVKLDRVPAVGQSATVTAQLRSQQDLGKAQIAVRLPQGLRITSPGFSAPAERGLDTVSTRALTIGKGTQTVSFTVTADEAGPAQIQVDVTDVDAPAPDRTAHATSELTVGTTAATSRKAASSTKATARRTDGSVQKNREALPPASRTATKAAADQVCATGDLQYANYQGQWLPGRRATVKVVGKATADAAAQTLATGVTDAQDGGYSLCFAPASTTVAEAWVELSTTNDWWQVTEMTGATPYLASSGHLTDIATGTTQDFGTSTPAAIQMRAFNAFDVINKIYDIRGSGTQCWTGEQTSSCDRLKARWAPGNADGGYYNTDPKLRSVYLTDAMPDAPQTVVHEAGHNFQHLLYNWNWTNGDCPSRTTCTA